MNGWSSHVGGGGWDDEPAWLYEITWEWEPLPGQRYPGDQGRRRAVHVPVYEASRGDDVHGVGVAQVGPSPASPPPRHLPARQPSPRQPPLPQPPPRPAQRQPGSPYSMSTDPVSPPRPVSPFEQTRPIPQDVRPQFRDAPPPVQDMPPPFYGTTQPTMRDARPRPNGAPAQRREPYPGAPSRGEPYPGEPRSGAPSRSEPYPGEPYSGAPSPGAPPGPRRPAPSDQPAAYRPGPGEPPVPYQPGPAGPGRAGSGSMPYRPGSGEQPTPYRSGPGNQPPVRRDDRPASHPDAPPPGYGMARPVLPASPPGPRPPRWETPEVYREARPFLNDPPRPRDPRFPDPDDTASMPASGPARPPQNPTWTATPTSGPARHPHEGTWTSAPTSGTARPIQDGSWAGEPVSGPTPARPIQDGSWTGAPVSGPTPARRDPMWTDVPSSGSSPRRPAAPDETDPRLGQPPYPPAEQATDVQPAVRGAGWADASVAERSGYLGSAVTPSTWDSRYADPASTLAGPGAETPAAHDTDTRFDRLAEPITAPPAPYPEPVTAPPVLDHAYGPSEPITAPPADDVPASPAAGAPSPVPGSTGSDDTGGESDLDDEHGLGWRLKMYGLGAVTTTPEDEPATEHADAADEADKAVNTDAADEPVSGAPKQDWFAPVTDTRLTMPQLGAEADPRSDAVPETDAESPAQPAATADPAPEAAPRPEAATKPEATTDTEATIEPRAATGTEPTTEPEAATGPGAATESKAAAEPDEAVQPASAEPAAEPEKAIEPNDTAERMTTARPEPGAPAADTPADIQARVDGDIPAADIPARADDVVPAAALSSSGSSARNVGDQRNHPRSRLVDPEQVLAAYPWRFSPESQREVIDEPDELLAVRDRLTDKLEYAERDAVRARLLSLRAVVSRVLGDLDFALADAREALVHAEATGELRRTSIVQARLANVLRWRGEFAEADRLFEEANSIELPARLRSEIAELAGRSAYEQGRYLEAMNRFEQALDLRNGGDDEMVARIGAALDSVVARSAEKGWGPYPRDAAEIRQRREPQALQPGERFAEVQAFHEQSAWVRKHDAHSWELVDARGDTVIGCAEGYLQARPFCEGLAWVSRDPAGGFFAIDHDNRVIVPGGFDDVLPFHHGVAPVRRGAGWGAIDRYGRVVIPPKYRRFATALAGGVPVDGFTGEGLAVIDAGDRYGVIDRSGQLRVAPVHAAVVIHPVAFLIGDRDGRWGALDRDGDPLVDVVHRTEADVTDAIDQLLADTRPVL